MVHIKSIWRFQSFSFVFCSKTIPLFRTNLLLNHWRMEVFHQRTAHKCGECHELSIFKNTFKSNWHPSIKTFSGPRKKRKRIFKEWKMVRRTYNISANILKTEIYCSFHCPIARCLWLYLSISFTRESRDFIQSVSSCKYRLCSICLSPMHVTRIGSFVLLLFAFNYSDKNTCFCIFRL